MKEYLQGLLHQKIENDPNEPSAEDIASMLIEDHQYGDDDYIGGREAVGFGIVRIPDQTGISLPGRANPVEEYFRGNKTELLVQRLGITPKKAEEVIKILGKKNFKIAPA